MNSNPEPASEKLRERIQRDIASRFESEGPAWYSDGSGDYLAGIAADIAVRHVEAWTRHEFGIRWEDGDISTGYVTADAARESLSRVQKKWPDFDASAVVISREIVRHEYEWLEVADV